MDRVIEFNVDLAVDDLEFNAAMDSTTGDFSTSFEALQTTTLYENDYEKLEKKPKINEVTLIGNKTSDQLNLQSRMNSLSNMEIESLINAFV